MRIRFGRTRKADVSRSTVRSERADHVRRMLGNLRALESHLHLQPSATAGSIILFDGRCGFCTWCVGQAKRLDAQAAYAFLPYQCISDRTLAAFGISRRQCDRSIQALTASGRVYSAAHAVNAFLFASSATRALVVLLYVLWPLLLAEIGLYRLIANQRVRISAFLRTQECALLPEEPADAANGLALALL
jgi:predicted DCC family thiol-disulfide oxidoreductase YuxK